MKSKLITLAQHVIFWAISFFILLKAMDQDGITTLIDGLFTFTYHIHLVVLVSLNTLLLIPWHLEKGHYWAYSLTSIANIGLALSLSTLSFDPIATWLFPNFYFVQIYTPIERLGIILIYLIVSTLLLLSKSWAKAIALQKEVAELKELSSSNELKILKAQVSPHFLFNSLNTIYGKSLKGDTDTANHIMSLSKILRYNLESDDEELASLKEEISYVEDYLKLQKSRLDHPEQIRFTVLGDVNDHKVPSLMIIEFIENALKHGNIKSEGAYIDIKITILDNGLEIFAANTLDPDDKANNDSTGLGLENIRKRLKLLYEDRFSLKVQEKKHEYVVELTLNNE